MDSKVHNPPTARCRTDPGVSKGAAFEFLFIGAKKHMSIKNSHSGSQAQDKGTLETMVCRILVFMWSSWVLI